MPRRRLSARIGSPIMTRPALAGSFFPLIRAPLPIFQGPAPPMPTNANPPPHARARANAAATRRRLAAASWPLALAAALGGCVAFERAPVAELRCDPDLAGAWTVSAGNGLKKTAHVDARCHTDDWPGMNDKPVAMDFTGFAIGQDRYLALTPEQAQRAMGADPGALTEGLPAGAVFLVLYRIGPDGALHAWLPDSKRALDAIARGELRGRRLKEQFALVEGDPEQMRDTLSQRSNLLYDTDRKAMVFERAAERNVERAAEPAKAARQDSP